MLTPSRRFKNFTLYFHCFNFTFRYICKSIDIAKDSMLKPADWKFQEKATKWHQLETLVDFDRLYLIAVDKDPETLKKQLQVLMNEILNYFYNTTLKTLNVTEYFDKHSRFNRVFTYCY